MAEELLIYETLLGAWPLEEFEMDKLRERLLGFVIKAAREAKQSTSWLHPN